MGRPKKWPTYALESLERTVDELKELEAAAKAAQDSLLAGNTLAASSQIAECRVMALKCARNLLDARIGKFEQQEKGTRWNQSERTAEAVAQVIATRH